MHVGRVCGSSRTRFRPGSRLPRSLGQRPFLALLLGGWLGAGAASAAEGQPPAPPAKDVAEMDLEELGKVQVSPFDVATARDDGYRASNSVSGSRFDAPIRELPFAIQAFTASFIHDQKPVNVFDIARYSPGVTYRSNDFNEGNANVAIRGFAIGSLTGGNIHVLRDGFHGPSILEFTNVSRVEVVKGPASFLYGQVAPGGIVNVITKSPQSRHATSAEATFGSYGQYRIEADVTGPASRTLFWRLAASHGQDIAYWKPYDAHSLVLAPSVLWQPRPGIGLSVKYERFRKTESPQVMQKPGYNAQVGPLPTPADPNLSGVDVPGLPDAWNSMSTADYRHSETDALSTWLDLHLADRWDLRLGYSHLEYVIDAASSGNFGMANNQTLLQGRRFRRQTYGNRDDTFEAQAVATYASGGTSLRLLLGAQYVARRFDNRAGQAPNDPSLGSNPIASPLPLWDLADPSSWNRQVSIPLSALTESRVDQVARYADRSVHLGMTLGFLGGRLQALAGCRLTSTRARLSYNLTGQGLPEARDSMLTPQYGLLYRLLPGVSAFASYAESFVPGTYAITNPDGTTSIPKPTRGQGYEGGLKGELLGGRLSGTLTWFELRNRQVVNDLSVTNSTGAISILTVQSGEQRSRGLELDVTLTLAANWQMYLSYGYMDARITEFSGQDAVILAQDPATLDAAERANYRNVKRFHGAPLQMSAPHLANLWTRYDFARNELRGLYVGGGVNFVYDQTLLPDTPRSAHQTYALVNALAGYSVTWRPLRMTLELMGKNLAGEHYRPSQSTRARPREFLVTLTARP